MTNNPVIPPGLGRKLKKEALANMPIRKEPFWFHAEIKKLEEGTDASGAAGIFIEGYASTPALDREGEIIEATAFAHSLDAYMQNPILTYLHDLTNPIGKVTRAVLDENGLFIRAFVSAAAGAVYEMIRQGILKAFSVGGNILADSVVNGVRHITDMELWEITVGPVPVNQECLFSIAKAILKGNDLVCPDCAKKCKPSRQPSPDGQDDGFPVPGDSPVNPLAWIIEQSLSEKMLSVIHEVASLEMRAAEIVERTKKLNDQIAMQKILDELKEVGAALGQ